MAAALFTFAVVTFYLNKVVVVVVVVFDMCESEYKVLNTNKLQVCVYLHCS